MRRTGRAVLAAALLVVLLIGIPIGLASTIGNPLDSWPAIKAGDLSSQVVIDLLAAVVWLCWAQFAIATALEGWAAARRVTLPTHVPLVYSGGRTLARTLIVAAFLIGPTIGSTLNPSVAYGGPSLRLPAVSAPTQPGLGETRPPAVTPTDSATSTGAGLPDANGEIRSAMRPAATTEIVIRGDGPRTFWDLAAAYLGDGQRWPEIWTLNHGRAQADGTVMTNPALLRLGWTIRIPADPPQARATGTDVVRPGDTLTSIAAADGLPSWHPLWQANANRLEPDGDRFTNPDLIRPGWMLHKPAPPGAPAESRPTQPTPHAPRPQPRQPTTAPPTGRHHPVPAAGHPAPERPPAVTPTAPATATGGPTSLDGRRDGARSDHSSSTMGQEVALFGGGGALLAGVSWFAVSRYRRRQFNFRRPGRAIPATPDDLVDLERQLRAASIAGIPDVTWLNQAIRSLVHSMAQLADQRLPDLLAVRISDDLLELVLANPHTRPPEPWRANRDGTRWTVHRDDPLPFDPDAVAFHFAPYPALSTIGHTNDGDVWLLDLERVAVLTITDAVERCLDLIRALAAELAHNVWSEQLQVTLVGFGEQMADLNPARLSYRDDLGSLLDTVSARRNDARAAAAELNMDALDSRLHTTAGEVWAPHVVLIAPDRADHTELGALIATLRAQPQRTGLALVLVDDTDPPGTEPWTGHLAPDGTLRLPGLGLRVHARQVADSEAAALTQLMVQCASTADQPMPPARGRKPWDRYTDVTGALLPHVTIARDQAISPRATGPGAVPAVQPVVTGASRSLLPQPDEVYLDRAAVVADDLDTLAPGIAVDVRKRVEDDNNSLDEDLADWYRADADRPKLRLLGPVGIAVPDSERQRQLTRVAMSIEVITYLASRRNGATVSQVATALWPHDPDILDKTLPRQKVSAARRLLGHNPRTGRDHIPHGAGGVYVVEDLLIDAELCRRLHTRGTTRGADGISDLWKALDLVVGVPLDQRREGGYEWLLDTPLDIEYLAMIVDISSKVVAHELGRGDTAAAMRAAHVPLKAGSSDDTVLLNMMKAHDAAGERALGDACVRQILASFDVEDEVDLPPRTAEILRRRKYG